MNIDHLPNSKYITRVIEGWKAYPQRWTALSLMKYPSNMKLYSDLCIVYNERSDNVAFSYIEDIEIMGIVARAAILCLVVHEDSGYMLDSDPYELSLLAHLGDQKAILMTWACHILKEINC